MRDALETAGFGEVSAVRLPLCFRAPKGQFPKHFRAFAARAAVILDKQSDDVLGKIYATWEAQLEDFLMADDHYQVPMPALAVSAVRRV